MLLFKIVSFGGGVGLYITGGETSVYLYVKFLLGLCTEGSGVVVFFKFTFHLLLVQKKNVSRKT